MNENIAVQVTDGVAASISQKLKKIADEARKAYSEIQKLQKGVDSLAASQAKLAASNQKLSSGSAAATRAQAAQARANTQLATAQNASAASAARLQAAQSNAAAAATRAQTAAVRLAQAQAAGQKAASAAATGNQNVASAAAAAAATMQRGGMTAKAYNNALRGVPAQITDIVVSLQGGQAPFTVFLQQGGQLKDMFGGIVPAAKALSASFMGMINVWTLAAAAVVALGIAMAKFESQARQFNSILAQFQATGRGELGRSFVGTLREELNTLPGITRSVATQIINEFASVRNIGGPMIQQASKIVADFAAATGTTAPKAAKELAEALQDPLKGAIKLDQQLGFLTIAQFKQIAALTKAGQTAKAQQVIIDALSRSVKGLAEESMTPLQKATNQLSNSWDKLMGSLSDSKFLQDAVSALAKMLEYMSQLVVFLDKFGQGWQQLSNMGPGSIVSAMRGTTADATLGSRVAQGAITGPDGKPIQIASSARTGPQYQQTTKFKTDAAGITGSQSKEAENRAKALAKVNEQLNNEIERLGMLEPAREKQQKFDQIEEQLLGRGIKLRQSEIASIKQRIDTIVNAKAFQEQLNRAYEEAVEPARTYHATEKAIGELLAQNAITREEADKQLVKAFETYANIKDPMREYLTNLEQEERLTGMLSDKKEIESKLQDVQNMLLTKGSQLRGDEIQKLRERLSLLQQNQQVQEEYNRIYGETLGAEKNLQIQIEATNRARSDGLLTMDQYKIKMNEIAVAQANLRLNAGTGTMEDVALGSFGKVVDGYQGMLSGLTGSFGNFFTSVSDGFADSFGQAIAQGKDLEEALGNVARNALGQLISSLVKLGIQYAINATIGSSVAASATAASAALAAATAAAWAPAAAAVSLASYGANAIPAEAGMAAVYASSRLMAAMPGFMDGGWTGNMGRNEVAGLVHGQEMVMNAPTTARNRELLDAISSGAITQDSLIAAKSASGGTTLNVAIDNQVAGAQFEVQQLSPTDVRIIARQEMNKQGDSMVARNFNNSNSKTSRALYRTTNTRRSLTG